MIKEFFEEVNLVENFNGYFFKFKTLRGEVIKCEKHHYEVNTSKCVVKVIDETIIHVLMSDSSIHILHIRSLFHFKNKIKKYKICKGNKSKVYNCEFVRIIN
jgi:hypothetical protein